MFLMENDTYTIKLTDLCHAMDLNEVTVSNDHRLVTNAWMPLEVRTTGHVIIPGKHLPV